MPLASRQLLLRLCLAALIIYTGYQCVDFIRKALPTVIGFIKAAGDHDVLRGRKIPYFRPVLKASQLIPPGESVNYSKNNFRTIDVIAIRYALYPVRVSDEAHYFMDLTGRGGPCVDEWDSWELPNHAKLFASAGYRVEKDKEIGQRFMFSEFAIFVLVSVLIITVGSNFLRAFGIGPGLLGAGWFYSSGYLTGFVLINWIFWSLLMANVHLDLTVILGVLTVVFFTSVLVGSLTLKFRHSAQRQPNEFSPCQEKWPRPLAIATQAMTIVVIGMIVLVAIAVPITVWDEMLIWVMRSKMLFYDGRIDFHYLEKTHVYYPNLWPLHIHMFFKSIGGCYSETLKWVSASVFLVFVSQIIGAVRVLNFKRLPHWLPVGFYVLICMNFVFFTALPENLFFALSMGMVMSLILWLNDIRSVRFLIVALIMAMGLSGIKFEGGVIVCALAVSAAIAGRSSGASYKQLCGLLWLMVPCSVPFLWMSWLNSNGFQYSVYHFGGQFNPENVGVIWTVVMASLSQVKNLIVMVLMLATYILKANRRPWDAAECLLGLAVVVFAGFSVSSVIFWPAHDIRLYFPEVLDRMFLRAAPFVMLLWMCRLFERKSFYNLIRNIF